jgi:putative DNA primase/helicase
LTSRTDTSGGPSPFLARLAGARLVTAAESGEDVSFNETVVKQLTGGDPIAVRHLYQNPFEFEPQFKLFLAANHLPRIRGTDEAIWRRMRVIPFNRFFSPEERDPELRARLASELPGILNWALKGLALWRVVGLQPPRAVTDETDAYRSDEDSVGMFVREACEPTDGGLVEWDSLLQAYGSWCKSADHQPVTAQAMAKRLTKMGYPSVRRSRIYYRQGLSLRAEAF